MELRDLPSVNELADQIAATGLDMPRTVVVERARRAIERARAELRAGLDVDPAAMAMLDLESLRAMRPTLMINATGVLLHTNLGRAPLSGEAARAAAEHGSHYSNLEFDLAAAKRGGRGTYVSELLVSLTGAEAALVVNNNAAALILAISALAGNGKVAVSRGELIEIGGSFRLPELMTSTGSQLLEVGTTNRTRIGDYEAVADRTALLLKVHPANYRIEGFAESADWRELADLARRRNIRFVADVGSGLLDSRTPWLAGGPPAWLAEEPAVRQTLDVGADVVLFSGDKLLGGPQAGVAVGRAEAIEAMAAHPLARAFRIAGSSLAALSATLEAYATGRGHTIPFWEMATRTPDQLVRRLGPLADAAGPDGSIVEGLSLPGAGSAPGAGIPTPQLLLAGRRETAWRTLLAAPTPVLTRRTEAGLVLDLRSVDPSNDDALADAVKALTG